MRSIATRLSDIFPVNERINEHRHWWVTGQRMTRGPEGPLGKGKEREKRGRGERKRRRTWAIHPFTNLAETAELGSGEENRANRMAHSTNAPHRFYPVECSELFDFHYFTVMRTF